MATERHSLGDTYGQHSILARALLSQPFQCGGPSGPFETHTYADGIMSAHEIETRLKRVCA